MAAAMLGYQLGLKSELESKKEIIFTRYLDTQLDLPLVVCLAIADYGDADIINNKKMVIEILANTVSN